MKRLVELADAYLNGCITERDYSIATAMEVQRIANNDIATLAFLLSYGEMPDREG